MELEGAIQLYSWGKLGSQSKVALLAQSNNSAFIIENEKCYAELWMGDHISGPSKIISTNQTLDKLLLSDHRLIGGMKKLPFLLKVLSIGKALSIQVHPSKSEAEELFANRPDLYKDPNHKPERAIALTPFLALCGFRPYEEIYRNLKENSALCDLIGASNIEELKTDESAGLKKCFSTLMHSAETDVNACIAKLNSELNDDTIDRTIFRQLNQEFPNDVGSLCLFFLNVIQLEPGQSIFLPAKEPHAYLSGDCIECMACSDNVVRVALTPKYKDVETLLSMLNYCGSPGESKLFKPKDIDEYTQLFAPSVEDFAVVKIQVPTTKQNYRVKNSTFGSIVIVITGNATAEVQEMKLVTLHPGTILFIPATSSYIDITNVTGDFVAYQAMYNEFL